MRVLDKAKEYAIEKHNAVNQKYDGFSYQYHLELVFETALLFIHLIPSDEQDEVLAGCWVHDVLEDTHETYNDLKKVLGETVAEYSYALQNNKGRTRSERANDAYYDGIRSYKHSTFIKLCDRIANVTYSMMKGSSMYKKYKKEQEHFYDQLYDGRYQELWDHLETLFN